MTRLALIVMAGLIGWPVHAQSTCGARDSVVRNLGEKYGEVRQGVGLTGSMAVYEIYASEETGSWTILKTTPNGMTCVMAVGEWWQGDQGNVGESL